MFYTLIISRVGAYTAFVFTFLQLIGFFINSDITVEPLAISMLVIPLRHIYLNRMSDISKNMARYIIWFGWDLAMVVLPCFLFDHYANNYFKSMSGEVFLFRIEDVVFCIKIGALTLFFTFISSVWWKNEEVRSCDYFWKLSDQQLYMSIIIIIFVNLSALILAKKLGTGTFGESAIQLPYKMTAIINFFAYGISCFISLFIMDTLCKKSFNVIIPIIILICLGTCESFVSLSKGAIVRQLVLILVYMIITKKLALFSSLSIAAILLFAFILGSYIAGYREAKTGIYASVDTVEMGYSKLQYIHRIFSDGTTLMKFHSIASKDDLFSMLKACEYNVAHMQTYAIDKTPIGSMHSSGCYTIPGAYAFGYTALIVITVFISLCCSYIDYWFPRSKSILSSTMMIVFSSYYFGKNLFPTQLLEMFTKLYNGIYNNALYMVLLILLFVMYLKFFCVRREI